MSKNRKKQYKHRSWLAKAWRRYEYKHTTAAVVTVIVFLTVFDTALVQGTIGLVGELGVAGIVLAGIMFTSFFTAAPAVALLLTLSDLYSPLTIAAYAGLGAAFGDWIILHFFEERIGYELKPLAKKLNILRFIRGLQRKKNRERATLAGMVVIASPLPDEMGIGLLGIAHLPTISLLVITYLLNAAGILVLILLA